MGKRKSKVSKQKQAKARQKQGKKPSSLGGVSVSKAFSSKFQQAKNPAVVLDSKNKNFTKIITEASLRQKLKSKTKKVFMSPPPRTSTNTNGQNRNNEQDEFHRQMASMQERQMAATMKKAGKKVATADVSFHQATFSLQKSPQDLLHETTRQMETMRGVGEQGIGSFSSTPIRTNQSWAVAKGSTSPIMARNPFEALGGDGSGEEEENELSQQVPSLSIAPATFSLLPRITPTPAASPHPGRFGEDEEDDPDL